MMLPSGLVLRMMSRNMTPAVPENVSIIVSDHVRVADGVTDAYPAISAPACQMQSNTLAPTVPPKKAMKCHL